MTMPFVILGPKQWRGDYSCARYAAEAMRFKESSKYYVYCLVPGLPRSVEEIEQMLEKVSEAIKELRPDTVTLQWLSEVGFRLPELMWHGKKHFLLMRGGGTSWSCLVMHRETLMHVQTRQILGRDDVLRAMQDVDREG